MPASLSGDCTAVNTLEGWRQGRLRWVVVAIVALLILTLALAPSANYGGGSSYSRAPDGYGAWFAYMQKRGTPLQRLQRPLTDLMDQLDADESSATLVRIRSGLGGGALNPDEAAWLERGHRLVRVGNPAPVTPAPFRTTLPSSSGTVQIETRRRFQAQPGDQTLLSDRFGSLILDSAVGQGRLGQVLPPHFGANAYQDAPGNFETLAQVVAPSDNPPSANLLWIDEYIHGYKDTDVIETEIGESWVSYLAQTPLMPVFIQLLVVLIIWVWAANRRMGKASALQPVAVDNSAAYIQALSAVLRKAQHSEFVVERIGREEQLQIQQALGLGTELLEPTALLTAWTTQTGRPAAELEAALQPYWAKKRLSESDLQTWLVHIKQVHQQLPELL